MNCALGPPKSVRYSRDFVIVWFVIAGFVSTYFPVILPDFQMLFVITGSSFRVRTGPGKPGKSWNFIMPFSRTGKSWRKGHWSWKGLEIC